MGEGSVRIVGGINLLSGWKNLMMLTNGDLKEGMY